MMRPTAENYLNPLIPQSLRDFTPTRVGALREIPPLKQN